MNRQKIGEFLGALIDPSDIDQVYICGPHDVNDEAELAVRAAGIDPGKIHVERFGVPVARQDDEVLEEQAADNPVVAQLIIVRDGLRRDVDVHKSDASLLEAAAKAGLEVPYSCKSGVCATCRAKLLEGEVRMRRNFALEKGELEAGFILTCQAQPLTSKVVVSFDER
jgi:ring-1,2-phenylacetyl-CoA epoxidase subunit PaaE